MDTFDLRWPGSRATLHTDGWRCRIVWRQDNGMGGSIDNSQLCKRRVAAGLSLAPDLLAVLKARGHERLAGEIEALARAPGGGPAAGESRAQNARQDGEWPLIQRWLERLDGEPHWSRCDGKRARSWITLGEIDTESLQLKVPARRGRREWVLKRAWSDGSHRPEYVVAASLRGLLCCLLERPELRRCAFVEQWLGACDEVTHAELVAAARRWREVVSPDRPH
ncbi:MAG: hypothetical protein R3E86_22640 [Pseudomonadales bacterium]